SAGRPTPLLVEPDGEGTLLDGDPGPPLGVTQHASYGDRTRRTQPPGARMLYSDGLVERRNQSITEGLARLEAACGPHTDPNTLLDQVVQALLGDESQPDDEGTRL